MSVNCIYKKLCYHYYITGFPILHQTKNINFTQVNDKVTNNRQTHTKT